MRRNFKYVLILVIGVVLLLVIEQSKPRQIDWSPSFAKNDKIPYGNYILFRLLPDMFPGQNLTVSDRSIYELSRTMAGREFNYIFINRLFSPGETDIEQLVAMVQNGSEVFIAASEFEEELQDTLKFRTRSYPTFSEMEINFTNPRMRNPQGYTTIHMPTTFFDTFDQESTTILARNEPGRAVLIRVRLGKGHFILSTNPYMFTNYNILKPFNSEFTFKTLSYLPIRSTCWDEFYKSGRTAGLSPIRYLLMREPLRWAYFITLSSIILFIIFEAKRKQRIIPVVSPLSNSSLEFVRTIGDLYYQNRNHRDLAQKKITYFLETLRSRFYLDTIHISEKIYEVISLKTGINRDRISGLFELIHKINLKNEISESELLQLNRKIEDFYQNTIIRDSVNGLGENDGKSSNQVKTI
jgi:hypothetical protein